MRLSLLVPLTLSGRQPVAAGEEYATSVLAMSPLAYYKLNEGSGTTITDSSGNGYDGVYTGVTWGAEQSPMGETAAFFDGDFGNLYSAELASAFDFDEITILLWVKLLNADLWTDGATHTLLYINRDASNSIRINKAATNNQLAFIRVGNGTNKTLSVSSLSDTDWMCLALSCSVGGGGLLTAGDLRVYKDGVEVGTVQTGNVAATGTGLNSAQTLLGAFNQTPIFFHQGYMAQVAIYDRAMDNDILALMTV